MMRAKKYDDAYNKKTTRPWSDFNHDVLLLVMMKLEVIDFLAFGGVCKSWRSIALPNRNKFIVSRPPMSLFISFDANHKEYYYLKDFEGRNLKIALPNSSDRMCVGLTCGYLILFGEMSKDFWLVNPITRYELYFGSVPNAFFCRLGNAGATLVFSPSISGWVFVVFNRCFNHTIWFCIAGKREWTKVSTPFAISDLIAFKGKIYTLHSSNLGDELKLCEMILYPKPEFVLLNFPKPYFMFPRFVNSGENLYVIDLFSDHPKRIHEIDLYEMKWVSRENAAAGEEYAFFCSKLTNDVAFLLGESWADLHSKYRRFYLCYESVKDRRIFNARMWYFFHDCLNVNLLNE